MSKNTGLSPSNHTFTSLFAEERKRESEFVSTFITTALLCTYRGPAVLLQKKIHFHLHLKTVGSKEIQLRISGWGGKRSKVKICSPKIQVKD